jgi:hypothetical protein
LLKGLNERYHWRGASEGPNTVNNGSGFTSHGFDPRLLVNFVILMESSLPAGYPIRTHRTTISTFQVCSLQYLAEVRGARHADEKYRHSSPPQEVPGVVVDLGGRLTWYRLCAILIPLCIIIPKIVTSLRGESLAPNLMDMILGFLGVLWAQIILLMFHPSVLCTLDSLHRLYIVGWFENSVAPEYARFFQDDSVVAISAALRLLSNSVETFCQFTASISLGVMVLGLSFCIIFDVRCL